MYLQGSTRRISRRPRRRSNPFFILLLLFLIAGGFYFNQVIVPEVPPLFLPTPTATRNPESFITEARDYFSNGNFAQAIDSYSQAELAQPDDASIYLEKARVQIYAGRYQDALTSTSNALIKSKNNPQAMALQGWAQYFLQDYLAAEAILGESLALNPDNPYAHAFLAEVLAAQGLFDRAGEHSRTAVSIAPNLLEVRRARAVVLTATGNYPQAIQEYQAALAINDNIADLHLLLGINLRAVGDFDQAVNEFIKANSLRPEDPIPDTYIAETYAQVGQFGKAVQYAEQAVNDDPTNPVRYGNLGIMLYRNQQREEAIEPLKLAVLGGLNQNNQVIEGLSLDNRGRVAEFYTTLGLALARTNRCAEAVPIFQAVLMSAPSDDVAVFNSNYGIELCQEALGSSSP